MSIPRVALKDESSLITKGTTPTSLGHPFTDAGVPFVRAQNLVDRSVSVAADPLFISSETNEALKRSKIQANDVLISIAGTIGRAAIVPSDAEEMNCNQAVAIVRPSEKIDRRYFLHWLSSNDALSQMAQGKVTGVISNLSLGEIGKLKIPLPPLEEQKRIAGILDQADALRRLRTHALDKLNALGQEIFHEMFGDPLKEQRNSPDWTLETLDDSISYIDYRGKTPPKAPIGIRLITAKNVKMGYINPEPMEFILEEAFSGWMTRGFPKKGDVLFTTEAPLGNVAILDSDQILAVGQRLLTMQPDHSKIVSEYLAFYLRTPEFTKRMIENSSGSTVRGIKSKLLKKIEICYPPLRLQERFAEALNAYNSNKLKYEIAAQGSHALFASLQHRAFRGEL